MPNSPFPLNMLDFRALAISLKTPRTLKTRELTDYIELCQTFSIDPIDAYSAMIDDLPHITNHYAFPLIERQILQIFLIDSYLDNLPDSDLFDSNDPYRYYTDSCHDEMTELLDYDEISDNDEYALTRRIDEKQYDLRDDADFCELY